MKVERLVLRPAIEQVETDYFLCDLCAVRIEQRCSYEIDETTVESRAVPRKQMIERKIGTSYPEGGDWRATCVDLCGTCFETRLIPWLESQGAVPRTEEGEW
jgi:hypothetical protein